MQSKAIPANRKPVLLWLGICLSLIMAMVVVGGLTRLTESGLSMVYWKPAHILPPITDAEWAEEFKLYQESPQYQQVNRHMDVDAFQGIFWLEYIHRLLGRLVGLVFLLPLIGFLLSKHIDKPLAIRLTAIFLLGGLQGFMGWYMVKSGLANVPWVSPLRLMMHLSLAFLLFSLLWWQFMRLRWPEWQPALLRHNPLLLLILTLCTLQIMLGALVAGLDAGLLFDSFPDMNGEWVPSGIGLLEPWYRNLYENPTTVHFLHRFGALLATVAIIGGAIHYYPKLATTQKYIIPALLAVLAVQILLGAVTVIYHVPILPAVAHQAVALLLLAVLVSLLFFAPPGHGAKIDATSTNQALTSGPAGSNNQLA